MIKDLLLPDLGEGIEGAEVSEVSVSVGDKVSSDDIVLVLESDKASMEIPAETSGIIKEVLVAVGDEIEIGQLLFKIEAEKMSQEIEEKKETSPKVEKTSDESPIKDLLLPDLGEGIEGAEVSEVSVSVGDKVAPDDIVLVLESDKASMEIPAETPGTIKEVLVAVGDEIEIGQPLFKIEAEKMSQKREEKKEISPKAEKSIDDPTPTPSIQKNVTDSYLKSKPSDGSFASPGVRKLARELNINLAIIKPTGEKGRITKIDLHSYIKSQMLSSGNNVSVQKEIDFSQWGEVEVKKLTKIKKVTGRRLQEAWQTIPHVTQHDESDITELDQFRKKLKKDHSKDGVKITFLPFLMKACAMALKQFDSFNSSLDHTGNNLIIKGYYNIGIAVDTEEGLVVPVIKDVDKKSIVDLSEELMDISKRSKSKALKPKEMKGGTFTISSLGGIGGTAFSPIVNPPEVAIMGVSRSKLKPVFFKETQSFEPRLIMPFSISYDHRVIDGALAARFTSKISSILNDVSLFKN